MHSVNTENGYEWTPAHSIQYGTDETKLCNDSETSRSQYNWELEIEKKLTENKINKKIKYTDFVPMTLFPNRFQFTSIS